MGSGVSISGQDSNKVVVEYLKSRGKDFEPYLRLLPNATLSELALGASGKNDDRVKAIDASLQKLGVENVEHRNELRLAIVAYPVNEGPDKEVVTDSVAPPSTIHEYDKETGLLSGSTVQAIEAILAQNRNQVDFRAFVPSRRHLERMESWAAAAASVEDESSAARKGGKDNKPSSSIAPAVSTVLNSPESSILSVLGALWIPRDKWLQHPAWNEGFQMAPYHVHFRVEMQQVLKIVWDVHASTSSSSSSSSSSEIGYVSNENMGIDTRTSTRMRDALRLLTDSLSTLGAHVRIEERRVFPQLQQALPQVDLSFLNDDHGVLLAQERNLLATAHQASRAVESARQLTKVTTAAVVTARLSLAALLCSLVAFDACLLSHLGEEEDIVTPMMLLRPMR